MWSGFFCFWRKWAWDRRSLDVGVGSYLSAMSSEKWVMSQKASCWTMIWVNILSASSLLDDKVYCSPLDVLQKLDGVLFLAAVVDCCNILQLCIVSQLHSSSETFALLLRVATSHVGGPFTCCAELRHFEWSSCTGLPLVPVTSCRAACLKDKSGPLLSVDLWNGKGKERKVAPPGIEPRASGLSNGPHYLSLDDHYRSSDCGGVPSIGLPMLWLCSLSIMINNCTQQSSNISSCMYYICTMCLVS